MNDRARWIAFLETAPRHHMLVATQPRTPAAVMCIEAARALVAVGQEESAYAVLQAAARADRELS